MMRRTLARVLHLAHVTAVATVATVATVAVVALGVASPLQAQTGNIDPTQRHSWGENAGWLDLRPLFGGVTVQPTFLSGYAWHENAGWVKLGSDGGGPYGNTSATDWGVNLNVFTGILSGRAWSENAGWIRMDTAYGSVTLDPLTHRMSGYAWAENLGWIHFRGTTTGATPAEYGVALACGTITGTVTGGGAVCEGSSSTVTVTVAGGVPPYVVTLDNGGGTQNGAGPVFTFGVTPSATTTYAVSSMTDALICAGSGSGSATVTVNARPATPVILAPDTVLSERAGYTASIPAVSGATYAWTITNGTITGGGTGASITFTSGTKGPLQLGVTVTSGAGCASAEGKKTVTVLPVGFYVVTPCRVIDTRELTPPVFEAGEARIVSVVGGACGVPATARAIVLNMTVVYPAAPGYLTLYPGDQQAPLASSINFRPGQVRANNAIVSLGAGGTLGILNGAAGTTNVIVDVSGYFQ